MPREPDAARVSNNLPTLAVCAGAALVLAMFTIVVWTLADARKAARQQAEQQAGNIALTLERDIGQTLATLDLTLRAAAQGVLTPGLADMDPQLRRTILFDDTIAANGIGGIYIFSNTGDLLYDSLKADPHTGNIADRTFFSMLRDHPDLDVTIGDPVLGRWSGKWILPIARRISRPSGGFAGIVVAELPISLFSGLFSDILLGDQGIVTVMNTDGLLITRRPFAERDIGRRLAADNQFRQMVQSRAGNFEAPSRVDGLPRLYSYRRVGNWPLIVSVGFSTQEIYADWSRKTAIIGGVLLLLTLLGTGLSWLLLRRIETENAARRAAAAARNSASLLADALAPLDALFSKSTDSMLVARVGADGAFTYEAVNPVWEQLTGISRDDAIGREPVECLPPDLAEIVIKAWRACVQEGRPHHYTFQIAARTWDSMTVPIVGPDGRINRLISVGREVTQRNLLEAQLRQSQKMEVVGQLAAGVAHDFNNILQVISGGIDLLTDQPSLPHQARSSLEIIGNATRRGATLTHHLLSYSRKQTLRAELVDVGEIIDGLNGVLSRTLGSNIILTTQVSPHIGPVKVDRGQLETALINLAVNAADAMPNGGELSITAGPAQGEPFGELGPGRHIVIAVTDTGTGIAPEVLANLFEPFFTTKGLKGTGLGLPMVQGFSRQSGGDVRVITKPGEGSSFEIWLPQAEAVIAPSPPAQLPAVSALVGHVLLVDDAPDVLVTLSAFLRNAGLTVHMAKSGQEALAALTAGQRFDLLITDYMMPGMNGLVLVKRARLLRPNLPAMVVSGFADIADFVTGLPGTVLLHKPFQRSEFIAQIRILLARAKVTTHHP